MAPEDRPRQLGALARRVGYAAVVLINLAILYVVNVRPGWRAASFLTDATPQVLTLVNLSLLAGVAGNVVYILADGPWVKRLGDLTTTTISMAVLIRIWQVFPFDFAAWTLDWASVVRTVLVVALIGTGIAMVVHAAAVVRLTVGRLGHPGAGGHALR